MIISDKNYIIDTNTCFIHIKTYIGGEVCQVLATSLYNSSCEICLFVGFYRECEKYIENIYKKIVPPPKNPFDDLGTL